MSPAVQVQVQDAYGNLNSTATNQIMVAIAKNPGASTLSGTIKVNAVGGTATFSDLSLNNAGVGYTLSATAPTTTPSLTAATSTPFNIIPAYPMLSLSKSISSVNSTLGYYIITYTLAYANSGCTATNVVITDALPSSETYVAGSATVPPTVNGNTLSWNLLGLGAGAAGEVTFQVDVANTVVLGTTVTNQANINCTEVPAPVLSNPVTFTVGDWWMFHHDVLHTGYSPFLGPSTPALDWSYSTGGEIYSSAAIGIDGTIYVGSYDGNLYAVTDNGTSCAVKWKYPTGGPIYSSPAIGADGTIYVGSSDDNLYAISPAGALNWKYATKGPIYSSPAIDSYGIIYVGSEDNNLYALTTRYGTAVLVWTAPFATGGPIYSSPAVSADRTTVYIGSSDFNLYAVNTADGTQKWKAATGGQIWSSPAIGPDGAIYVGSYDDKLYAFNATDGTQKWSPFATKGQIYSSPALNVDGSLVFVGSEDDSLYAINSAKGTPFWSVATKGPIDSSPAVDANGTVYVVAQDNNLYAFGEAAGAPAWKTPFALGSYAESGPAIGANGTLYVGTVAGSLCAIGSSTPNISLIKSVWPTAAQPGSVVTYTLAYTNYGSVANNVTFSDTLPAGVAYVPNSATGNASYNAATTTLTWLIGSLAPGEWGQVTFQAIVAPTAVLGSQIVNTASVSSGSSSSSVTSNTATITVVGPEAQLAFKSQPTNTLAGADITPAVTVLVEDAGGNTITSSTDPITLALNPLPPSVPIVGAAPQLVGGTVTVNAVNGVATFSTLVIDKATPTIPVGTTYTLSATSSTPNLGGATSAPFVITPNVPSQLSFLTEPSNTQAGFAFDPTVTVGVEDAYGNLVSSSATNTIMVTMAIGNNPGNSVLDGNTTVTVVNGVASFFSLSMTKEGTGYTLSASTPTGAIPALSGATSTSFNITAGTPQTMVFLQQPTNTSAGATITPAVTVELLDGFGNIVTNGTLEVTIAIGANPGGSTLSGKLTVYTVNGVATFNTLMLDKSGSGYTLTATCPGWASVTSSPFDVSAGTANQLAFLTQPSTTTVGAPISPAVAVEVLDAYGNLVANASNAITLALASNPGGSTLGGTLTVKAVQGVATFSTLTLNQIANGYTLYALPNGLTGVISVPFNIIEGPPVQLAFQVQPSTTVAGNAISPAVTVEVLDAVGNLLTTANSQVTLALASNPGGSTLSGMLSANASGGVATFNMLMLNQVGNGYTLSASAPGVSGALSSAFNITAGSPSRLAFQLQPSTMIAGGTMVPAVSVQVLDINGNPVPTATNAITLALATNPGGSTLSGTVTVHAVNGVALFNTLSLNKVGIGYSLSASASGLTGATSSIFNVIIGSAAQLAFQVQPSTTAAGATINPAVTVQVQDAYGNLIPTATNTITLVLAANPGGSLLEGNLTMTAVNGVATFNSLMLNKAGSGYTLSASSAGCYGTTSAAFSITPGLPSQLAFLTQPSTTIAGAIITPAVTVQVQDAGGNLVPTASNAITLALAANPGNSTEGGVWTVYAINGVATFNSLTLNKVGSGYIMSASAAGLTGAGSSAFNIVAGTPAQLAFQLQPSTTAAGIIVTPAVTVQILDANGDLLSNATNTITLALGTNPSGSTLSGQLSVQAVNGVATFNTLSVNYAGVGYTLTAIAPGLTGATSSAFTIMSQLPSLALTKSVSQADAAPNGIVTYTIAYNNLLGTAAATNVLIKDALPSTVTYVTGSASGNGIYLAASNTLTWSIASLPAGGSGQVTFQALVASTATPGSTISNTAQITSTQTTTPVSSNSAAFSVVSVALLITPASPATLGQPVTLSASIIGGSVPEYRFTALYLDASGNEQQVLIQDYAANSTCTWIPALAATYTVIVCVREPARPTPLTRMMRWAATCVTHPTSARSHLALRRLPRSRPIFPLPSPRRRPEA